MDDRSLNAFFREYKNLGGHSDLSDYKKNLQKFFDLTLKAYTGGVGSRELSWSSWLSYIGDETEADLYFQSVDNIHAYT